MARIRQFFAPLPPRAVTSGIGAGVVRAGELRVWGSKNSEIDRPEGKTLEQAEIKAIPPKPTNNLNVLKIMIYGRPVGLR